MKLEKAASSPKPASGKPGLPGASRSRVPDARAWWERWGLQQGCWALPPQHTQASSAYPRARDLLRHFNSFVTVSEAGSDTRSSYQGSAAGH